MKRRQVATLMFLALSSCSRPGSKDNMSREDLIELLRKTNVVDSGHVLTHVSRTCDLVSEGATIQILDVREIGKTASSPRGINHIAVFDSGWRLLHDISYVDQRPLFCQGSRLILFDKLAIRNEVPDGNVLEFREKGAKIVMGDLDFNTLPTLGESKGLLK